MAELYIFSVSSETKYKVLLKGLKQDFLIHGR
jgi:hypothetical protein